MSATQMEFSEEVDRFLRNYYHEEILELAQRYPKEQTWLTIDWQDMFRWNPEAAEDYLQTPEHIEDYLKESLARYDLPIPVDLNSVEIRVVGLGDEDVYSPLELTKDAPEGYIGVSGQLAKITTPNSEVQTACFECVDCKHEHYIEQFGEEVQDPYKCSNCEKQGLVFNEKKSTFKDYCKVRIQTPPDESGDLQNEHIDGIVRGDLVWYGHDEVGLVGRSGDNVTVYGTIEMVQKSGRGANERLYFERLEVEAIEFESDNDNVDIAKHKGQIEELAALDDPVELWKEDLVPELYATDEWDTALELLVAYLFAAPRIDIPNGPTFRGDIHALIISDYGMGKSMVNSSVAMFSPNCIKESVTGMSSDVGLLAAAVEDDFGDGQWTLQPGILVRANGGHVILDEIDKTDANLERMNNALEGEQVVDVNKAGQRATYRSRVGLLATGNPESSRFNRHDPISEQLDLDQSFLSRFDGIVTMKDTADEEQDGHVAETQGLSYVEAQEYQYGERDELDRLDRTISPEVGMNWIAHARENIHPLLKTEHVETIKTWYAEEVRQLNEKFADNREEGGDMPVPVSARVVANTIRFSVAFARVELCETVKQRHVERAIDLSKRLVAQNFDGDKFVPEESRSQEKRVKNVKTFIRENPNSELEDVANALGLGMDKAESEIEKLMRKGEIYEPQTGEYQVT